MTIAAQHDSATPRTPEELAADRAAELAELLRSFAESLRSLDVSAKQAGERDVTPRNWWRLQAGRFADDPTFEDFVREVQAARSRGE